MQKVPLLLILSLLLAACASPEKLLDQGNYDQAIALATERLAGKNKKKEKFVAALEEAFARVTDRDMAIAERLKRDGRQANWPRIHDLYEQIRRRQERIAPLLPLVDENGIAARFQFVKVEKLEREARQESAAYLYQEALEDLRLARRGDRLAAREAYAHLRYIGEYYRDYRDRDLLLDEARNLGTSYVLLDIVTLPGLQLPRQVRERLISIPDLQDEWRVFHTQRLDEVPYDYQVRFRVIDLHIGPEQLREREYRESREIEDGEQYVLDKNGNVLKDSLGNDVTEPRKVWVEAAVLETEQIKTARVAGELQYIDLSTEQLLHREDISVDAVFSNLAATYRGDKRALRRETRRLIGGQALPFPTDLELLFQAVEQIKPQISRHVRRSHIIL